MLVYVECDSILINLICVDYLNERNKANVSRNETNNGQILPAT